MSVANPVKESTRRTGLVALGGGLLLAALIALSLVPGVSGHPFWGNVPYSLASGLLAAAGLVLATMVPKGVRGRRYALLLASGAIAYAVGDIIWLTYEMGFGIEPPYPGIPDLFYGPLMYLPMSMAVWGAALTIRSLDSAREPVIIATLAAVLVFILTWFTLLEPALSAGSAGWWEKAISTAYLAADVFLLFMPTVVLVIVLMRLGGESLAHPWLPVAAGALIFAFADGLYAYLQAGGQYASGMWIDVLWLVGLASCVVGISRLVDAHSVQHA